MSDGKKTDVPGAPLDDSVPTETPKLLQQDLGLDRRVPRPIPAFDQLGPPLTRPPPSEANLKETSPGYRPSPETLREATGEHAAVPAARPEYANTVISNRQLPPAGPLDFAKTQPSAANPVLAKLQADERAAKERLLAERQLAERNAAEKATNERLVAERLANRPPVPSQYLSPASGAPGVAAPRSAPLPPHLRDQSQLQTDPMREAPPAASRPQPLRQPLASRPLPPPVATPAQTPNPSSDVITDPMRDAVPSASKAPGPSASTVVQRPPTQVPKTDPMQQPDVLAAITRGTGSSKPEPAYRSSVAIPPPAPLPPRTGPASRPLPLGPAPTEPTQVSRPGAAMPQVTAPPGVAARVPGVAFSPSTDRTEIGRGPAPLGVAPGEVARTEIARPAPLPGAFEPTHIARAHTPLGVAPSAVARTEIARAALGVPPAANERTEVALPVISAPGVAMPVAAMDRTEVASLAGRGMPPGVPMPVTAMDRTEIRPVPIGPPGAVMPPRPEAVTVASYQGPRIDAPTRPAPAPQLTPTPVKSVSQQDLTPVPQEALTDTPSAPSPVPSPWVAPAVTAPAPPPAAPRPASVVPPSFMDLPPAMEKPRRLGPDAATTQPGIEGPYTKGRPQAPLIPTPRPTPSDRAPRPTDTVSDHPATTSSDELVASDQVLATPASLWRRALASIVDLGVLGGIVGGLLMLAVSITSGGKPVPNNLHGIDAFFFKLHPIAIPAIALTVILALLYTTLGGILLRGRTPGRLLFGIRLVDSSGKAPGLVRSGFRAVFAILSFALFLAGFWLSLFDRRGQTLHDKLTRTFVVRPV